MERGAVTICPGGRNGGRGRQGGGEGRGREGVPLFRVIRLHVHAMHSVTFTSPRQVQEWRKASLTAETCCSCSRAVQGKGTHTHTEDGYVAGDCCVTVDLCMHFLSPTTAALF